MRSRGARLPNVRLSERLPPLLRILLGDRHRFVDLLRHLERQILRLLVPVLPVWVPFDLQVAEHLLAPGAGQSHRVADLTDSRLELELYLLALHRRPLRRRLLLRLRRRPRSDELGLGYLLSPSRRRLPPQLLCHDEVALRHARTSGALNRVAEL